MATVPEGEDCDHSLLLHDDLGLVCRVCGVIQKRIDTIFDYQWTKVFRYHHYKFFWLWISFHIWAYADQLEFFPLICNSWYIYISVPSNMKGLIALATFSSFSFKCVFYAKLSISTLNKGEPIPPLQMETFGRLNYAVSITVVMTVMVFTSVKFFIN